MINSDALKVYIVSVFFFLIDLTLYNGRSVCSMHRFLESESLHAFYGISLLLLFLSKIKLQSSGLFGTYVRSPGFKSYFVQKQLMNSSMKAWPSAISAYFVYSSEYLLVSSHLLISSVKLSLFVFWASFHSSQVKYFSCLSIAE